MKKELAKIDIKNAVSKFRDDIIIANPVSFLVRVMNGEEFEGEKLNLRERVEVAKYLGSRVLPVVAAEEIGVGGNAAVTPPPLTIVLHATQAEVKKAGVDTMTVVGEHRADERDDDGNHEKPADQ